MIERVKLILAKTFHMECSHIDSRFSQSTQERWDSLAQLHLIIELEREFGCRFEPDEIGIMTDLDSIVKVLEQKHL